MSVERHTRRPRRDGSRRWRRGRAISAAIAVAIAALALIGAAGCGSGTPSPSPSPSGPVGYTSDKFGFSIAADARFETSHEYEAPLVRFKVGLLDVDGAADGRTPDTILITGIGEKDHARLSTPAGRKRLLTSVIREMTAAGEGGKNAWTPVMIGGLPAAWNVSFDKATKTNRMTCIVVGANDIYVLTGSSSPETWATTRPLFEAAFRSFREL
jgi:hypothetical protein